VTYQNRDAISYINENFIPWRVPYLTDLVRVQRWHVEWTPCLVVLDGGKVEHLRSLGFISPPELVAHLHLARALISYRNRDLPAAVDLFDQVVNGFARTHAAPQAIWFRGVGSFQIEGDPAVLKATRLELEKDYPHSLWVEKASAWGR
jgi:hypothetical protein